MLLSSGQTIHTVLSDGKWLYVTCNAALWTHNQSACIIPRSFRKPKWIGQICFAIFMVHIESVNPEILYTHRNRGEIDQTSLTCKTKSRKKG